MADYPKRMIDRKLPIITFLLQYHGDSSAEEHITSHWYAPPPSDKQHSSLLGAPTDGATLAAQKKYISR